MNTTSTLKVSIPITVTIDVEAWNIEYGGGFETAAQIRADVKRHIADMVQQQLDSLGVNAR